MKAQGPATRIDNPRTILAIRMLWFVMLGFYSVNAYVAVLATLDPFNKYILMMSRGLGWSQPATAIFAVTTGLIGSLVYLSLSILLQWGSQGERAALLFSLLLLPFLPANFSTNIDWLVGLTALVFAVGNIVWLASIWAWVFLYPDGHFLNRWTKIVYFLSLAEASTTYLLNDIFKTQIPDVGALIFAIAVGAMVIRYRRSSPIQRQQIKWLAFVFGAVAAYGILQPIVLGLFPPSAFRNSLDVFGQLVFTVLVTIWPIAVVMAIRRYRLWDIDLIIRRTLIYAILTAILATVYFGGVIFTQQVFKSLTGQGSEPAIVVTTLLIAALFTPLRRGVQNTIDRRLYRRRYDAEQTLAQFSQSLRDEVELDTLKAQLINVVQDTMQPRSVSLWLKEQR